MCNLHWCYTFCTGVTLFALVLHLNCTALSQSESSNFFMYIISCEIKVFESISLKILYLWKLKKSKINYMICNRSRYNQLVAIRGILRWFHSKLLHKLFRHHFTWYPCFRKFPFVFQSIIIQNYDVLHFLHWITLFALACYTWTALLSANQNWVIFSCILLNNRRLN